MKKLLCIVFMALVAGVLNYSVFAAGITVRDITPAENVGIYERGQDVKFLLKVADNKLDYNGYYIIRNIDKEQIKRDRFTISGGTTEFELNLGKFTPGWYRLYIYGLEDGIPCSDKYLAFSVVEQLEQRYSGETPFACDHAGIEWKKDSEIMKSYAKALALAGVKLVRERAYMSSDTATYRTNKEQTEAYCNNGLEVLNVWAKPNIGDWTDSLFGVYSMQKGFAEHYKGKVKTWEIVNEPDMIENLTPDIYQAYFKAAALGVYDADRDMKKAFGGLCVISPFFMDAMFANDVLDYSDIYNVHSHANGNSDTYTMLPAPLLNKGKILSTVYTGAVKPMWVTEAGIRLSTDSDENLVESRYETQAKYLITSTVESLTYGTDKHFYFLTRHFIENGKEFGIFHKDNMPYPAYSAFAALTYHLGKGEYKGDIKQLPDSVRGYAFDAGSYDAVVLWNTENRTDYVQLHSDQDVEVISFLGESQSKRYSEYHKMVNLPVTSRPIVVKLAKRLDSRDYYSRSYLKSTQSTTDRPCGIVIMPVWEGVSIEHNAYAADAGKSYNVLLDIYNFNDTTTSGNIIAKVGDEFSCDEYTKAYSVGAGQKTRVSFICTLSEEAQPGSQEKIRFECSDNAACVTSYFNISNENVTIPDDCKTKISGIGSKDNWELDNTGSCTKYNSYLNEAKFLVQFSNVTSRYSFPKFNIEKGFFADTTGVYIDMDVSQKTDSEKLMVRVWTESGGSFRTSGVKLESGSYMLPWNKFAQYGGAETVLYPENIIRIAVGFETYTDGVTEYTIKNLCSYKYGGYAPAEKILVEGLSDGRVYKKGTSIKAKLKIPEGVDMDNISVYLNFKPYDCEMENSEAVVRLDDLQTGAYSLIVSYCDKFGQQYYTDISFYVGEKDWETGTFY